MSGARKEWYTSGDGLDVASGDEYHMGYKVHARAADEETAALIVNAVNAQNGAAAGRRDESLPCPKCETVHGTYLPCPGECWHCACYTSEGGRCCTCGKEPE